ncbi:MAG: hypothetical protein QG670_2756 [Thermoproteota archaeon]|nr:hypothetical protein [Thermoproteota archaeon]
MKNDNNDDNIRCCGSCAYFEERRGIDKAVLCIRNQIYEVHCPDFEFGYKDLNNKTRYYRFSARALKQLVDTVRYDWMEDKVESFRFSDFRKGLEWFTSYKCPTCLDGGVACKFFIDRYQERNLVKQDKIAENVLLATPTS